MGVRSGPAGVRFGVGARLSLVCVGLSLLAGAVVGVATYAQFSAALEERLLGDLDDEGRVLARHLEDAVATLLHDVRFLSRTPVLASAVRRAEAPEDGEASDGARRRLAATFRALMGARPAYLQLRLIGGDGRELVRVERGADGMREAAELQDESGRPYFREAIALAPGATSLSPIELHREHGRIEEPHVPVLRAAAALHDDAGGPLGVVVATADARVFFASIQSLVAERQTLYVTDERGEFVLHPEPGRTFAFELGRSDRIQDAWPKLAEAFDGARAARAIGDAEVVSLRRVSIDPTAPPRALGIALAAPLPDVLAASTAARNRALGAALAAIALTGLLGWAAARSLVRPLEQVTRAVQRFGEDGGGADALALPVGAGDETGVLARAFRDRARRVERNTSVLEQALERAEEAERRAAAQALDLARVVEDLKRSNRELDDFAYVASHDLKAPLRAIENLSSFVVEDVGDQLPPESREHLERVQQRVRRMEKLLEDLLDFSRAGRIRHQPERLDAQRLVGDVVALLDPPPGFEIHTALDLPELWAPRVPLEQIFRNLIDNAIKHHDRERGRIEIGWADRGETFEFSVSDDGPGIPAEHHERVFRMFTTLRPRDAVEGSGMGLAVIEKLIEAAGGSIEVESVGRGSTFRFSWPVQR